MNIDLFTPLKHITIFEECYIMLKVMEAEIDEDTVGDRGGHGEHCRTLYLCSICNVHFVVQDHATECYKSTYVQLWGFVQQVIYIRKHDSLLEVGKTVREITSLHNVSNVT